MSGESSTPSRHPAGRIVLAVEGLTVAFDGFKAVDSLNLYLEQGELRVIIGPNGAGKTTLLDLICGKTRCSAGSIRFGDVELTRLSEYRIVRKGVGRKFQTPSIYENLTVFENLEVSFPELEASLWRSPTDAPPGLKSGFLRFALKSAWAHICMHRPVCFHMGRSNGSKSECC